MDSRKVLTISIGVYNGEKFIKECIDSIINSNVLGYLDVIIIDDGSEDKSSDIIKKYTEKYPQSFTLVEKDNGGVGSTYNTSIALAKGMYYMVMDMDDMISTRELNRFINCVKDIDSDLILFGQEDFGDISKRFFNPVSFPYNDSVNANVEYSFEMVCKSVEIPIHGFAVKTDILKQRDVYADQHYKQFCDITFIMRIIKYVRTVFLSDCIIYRYRISDGQGISLKGIRKYWKDQIKMVISSVNEYEKDTSNISDNIKQYMLKMVETHLTTAYLFILLMPEFEKKIDVFNMWIQKHTDIYYNMSAISKLIRKNTIINLFIKKLYIFFRTNYSVFRGLL